MRTQHLVSVMVKMVGVVVQVGRAAELVLDAEGSSERRRRTEPFAEVRQTTTGSGPDAAATAGGVIWCVTFVRNWFECDRTDHLFALELEGIVRFWRWMDYLRKLTFPRIPLQD